MRVAEDGRYDSLSELLDKVEEHSEESDGISIETIQEMAGRGAFGPLILLPGLIALSPLSGIPTVPSIIGIIVSLISIQLVLGHEEVWLPRKMRTARLGRDRVEKAMRFTRPVARVVDKVVKPRLAFATHDVVQRGAAAICFLVAVTMPPLEILPFLATTAGLVLTIFGLALTMRDGVLMIVALLVFLAMLGGGAYWFLV